MPDLKPELSIKSPYWIPRHRYYELKHYCLQYRDWEKLYKKMDASPKASDISSIASRKASGNLTENTAVIRAELKNSMDIIQKTAAEVDPVIGPYLFRAVTEDIPYVRLRMMYSIPCGQDAYYDCYRRFFYLLSKKKGM